MTRNVGHTDLVVGARSGFISRPAIAGLQVSASSGYDLRHLFNTQTHKGANLWIKVGHTKLKGRVEGAMIKAPKLNRLRASVVSFVSPPPLAELMHTSIVKRSSANGEGPCEHIVS